MPKKVLLALDGAVHTEKAFDWYIYHLHKKGAEVILCHYIDAENEKEYRKKEEKMLELQENYESRLISMKVDHQWITGTGSSPGEHVLKTAQEHRCEMIVMGARGLGKIKRALLGSVSDFVIRKAKVPVLICKWDS